MTADKNVFFKALNESEKLSKLAQLPKSSKPDIVIWKKGESKKHKLKVSDFIRSKAEIKFTQDCPKEFLDSLVLFSFDLNGLSLFGRGKIIQRLDNQYWLVCKEELFKSERRKNFRLLTYPHHKVYINFKIGKEKIKSSNVLSIKGGTGGQTALFTNFLDMLEDKEPTFDASEYLRFRVIDISVTGLAFQFGKIEAEFFQDLEFVFENSIIEFNDKILTIPEIQVLYMQEGYALDKKTTITKAGAAFVNLDTNLDEELSFLINKTLRNIESEFEGFLK